METLTRISDADDVHARCGAPPAPDVADATTVVAEVNGQVVAVATVLPESASSFSSFNRPQDMHLQMLHVADGLDDPTVRETLLIAVLDHLRELGGKTVRVMLPTADLVERDWYRWWGFVPTGKKVDNDGVSMVEMRNVIG